MGMDMFFLGVYFVGFSSILGSLNIIATIVRMRAQGMSYFRMPIFVWTALATAIIGLTATQFIGLSFQMVMFERLFGMGFFEPASGGEPDPVPAPVLVLFAPGGVRLHPDRAGGDQRAAAGLRPQAAVWLPLGGAFLVWYRPGGFPGLGAPHVHLGMSPYLRVPFMYSTLLVAIPTGVKFFSWVATIWEGKLSFETPMLFVLGAISIFLLGGLSGPPNGVVATDLHLQDTYWIVGHFHATMFGGFRLPVLCRHLLLVPKDDRADVQRDAWASSTSS